MRSPLPVKRSLGRLPLITAARAAAPGWAVLLALVLLVLLLVVAGSGIVPKRTMRYSLHTQARDRAGRWGPSTTDAVRGDAAPPQVTSAHVSDPDFNPALEALNLEYTLSKVSRVSIGLYDATGRRVRLIVSRGFMPAQAPLRVSWDGRDDTGKMVPAGTYSIYLRATDRLGLSYVTGWSGLLVSYKRIVVSLAQQRLWAYDGTNLLLTSLVTTGNKVLPTPTGLFQVMLKRHQFTFFSPWPPGSPFYYPPSRVNYGLYFHDNGYYIHDAPWRSLFGPGSNAGTGTPGRDYTGTHGCVNVPEGVMAQLYNWATPGTVVQIDP
jgi:hypothetical protein